MDAKHHRYGQTSYQSQHLSVQTSAAILEMSLLYSLYRGSEQAAAVSWRPSCLF